MPLNMYQESDESYSPKKIKHTLAIAAGKGGVGKSSFTANLARLLNNLGYSVGVMDTDLYGPSMRKMLPESRPPIKEGEHLIPAICSGIKMISMSYFRQDDQSTAFRAPIANNIITQFIRDVDWGELDFLLIDFPPGTGDIQLTLAQHADIDGAILLTTPQEVSVMDVKKAMHLFHIVKIPILGVVENMSYYYHKSTDEKIYIFGHGGGIRFANAQKVPFLGEIPIEPEICRGCDTGDAFFMRNPDSPASLALQSITQKVISQVEKSVALEK